MNKKLIIIVAVVVLSLAATTVAFAGRMRCLDCEVKGGGPGSNLLDIPTIKASGFGSVTIANMTPLVGAGDLTGLSNVDGEVKMTATAVVSGISCTNNGQQLVEAQPKQFTVTGIQFLPKETFSKNGRAPFAVVTDGTQVLVLPPSLFCPNNNWNATIEKLLWRGTVVLTATQPDQTLELKFECNQPDDVTQPFTCTPLQ